MRLTPECVQCLGENKQRIKLIWAMVLLLTVAGTVEARAINSSPNQLIEFHRASEDLRIVSLPVT